MKESKQSRFRNAVSWGILFFGIAVAFWVMGSRDDPTVIVATPTPGPSIIVVPIESTVAIPTPTLVPTVPVPLVVEVNQIQTVNINGETVTNSQPVAVPLPSPAPTLPVIPNSVGEIYTVYGTGVASTCITNIQNNWSLDATCSEIKGHLIRLAAAFEE